MNTISKYIIIVLLLIIAYNYFDKYIINPNNNNNVVITEPLKDDQTSSVYVNTNNSQVTLQQREDNGSVTVTNHFIPAESNYNVISSTITGKTTIEYNKKDFTLKPLINYSPIYNLGVGVRGFYWNEFGVIGCVNYNFYDKNINVSAGIDYRLYKFDLKNISISLQYNTEGKIMMGVSLYLN